MRTWIWGSLGFSLIVLAAGCTIETTGDDDTGKGGAGGEGSGGSGGSARGGNSGTVSTGGSDSSGAGGRAATGGESNGGSGGTPSEGGSGADDGTGGGDGKALGFTPSNVPKTGLGAGSSGDLFIGGANCGNTTVTIDTDTGEIGGCDLTLGEDYSFEQVEQSDGSKVGLFAANRVRIEQTIIANVDGQLPLVIVARDTLQVIGKLQAAGALTRGVGGGFQGIFNVGNTPGNGPGGGGAGKPGGGGSYCGKGGKAPTTSGGGLVYSTPEIVPLLGGSSGGTATIWDSGAGGGAIQLVAGTSIQIAATGVINVGGGGGGQGSNAGGSGGAILLEAPTVTVAGILAANGGGGGGDGKGQNGLASTDATPGGTGDPKGGDGSSAESIDGGLGSMGEEPGGGGGGAGVIRINSATGAATITGKLSPSLATDCASQGKLK